MRAVSGQRGTAELPADGSASVGAVMMRKQGACKIVPAVSVAADTGRTAG